MNAWLSMALSNAAIATLLAIAVAGVTRVWRKPPVAHALWLLVLVKLMTPPLLGLPVAIGVEPAEMVDPGMAASEQSLAQPPLGVAAAADVPRQQVIVVTDAEAQSDGINRWWPKIAKLASGWRGAILGAWSVGTAAWVALCVVRIARFNRLVRALPSAGDVLQSEMAILATRLGLRRWPELRLAEGAISPLVWAVGRGAVIVLPRPLVDSLPPEGQRALLAHELAHVYRGDHWVRRLELAVLTVYWWHPVAWWARRRLQAAEEQCCDACAVWLLGGAARSYGQALLATIDFLSDARRSPLVASAMGHFGNAQRRFEMILHSTMPRRLSWRARSVIASLALVTLPVSVYVAQAGAQAAPRPPAQGWARLSPFTDVSVRGDAATVQFDGQTYELVSIDDVPTKAILAAAKQSYGNLWEKRFVEDIVEVLEQLGRRPEKTVKLVLCDAQSGAIKTVDRAPLTAENRRRVYAARYRMSSSGYDLSHIVPFEVGASRLRNGDSITIVDVTGTSDRMTAGNMYVIKGTYKLASKEQATLLASVTASKRGDGQGVPTQKTQSVTVDQGNGHFTLILYMAYDGNPHISFYPAEGESFANVYFGTGDSVLKQGWWDKSE
jgi:beta-lactamase regulating signal transducer with metallopeptidase domain